MTVQKDPMPSNTTADSLWRRLPLWLSDRDERRVYGSSSHPWDLAFRAPWSDLMSVRMAKETPFFVGLEEGAENAE